MGEEWKEFRIFIGVIIILWMAWFFTGGVQRYEEDKPFIKRPNTPGSLEVYGPNSR